MGLLLVVCSWSSSWNQRNHEIGKLPPNSNPSDATLQAHASMRMTSFSSTITTQNTHQMLSRIISRTKESKSFIGHLKAQIWTLFRICVPRLIDIFRNRNVTAKKSCLRIWRRNESISMKSKSVLYTINY